VVIPEENAKDLADIPANVTEGLDIRPVRWIDQVLDIALARQPTPPARPRKPSPPTSLNASKGARASRVVKTRRAH
jgi:ATP-dependent Lon protease